MILYISCDYKPLVDRHVVIQPSDSGFKTKPSFSGLKTATPESGKIPGRIRRDTVPQSKRLAKMATIEVVDIKAQYAKSRSEMAAKAT